MSDIKLFIACHRDDIEIPDIDLLYPVQVGAALSKKRFKGMIHDDEGDNISAKNPSYCELTAQYWAWKNTDADYYGLLHYRRYFSFSKEHFNTNYFSDVLLDTNDEATLKKLCFNEQAMRETIEQYDFIVPEQGRFATGESIRSQYYNSPQHEREDLDVVMDIISEQHPEMVDAANKYLDGTTGYFCNMFIMKKELFNKYCEWLFGILEEHEKRRDFSQYSPSSLRVSGYLAERLLGVYITYLKDTGNYTYRELQRTLFEDVSKQELLNPAFEEDETTLVLAANDYYVPYLSALLQSILENSRSDNLYDIIVLHTDISSRNQKILKRQMSAENFCLRFFNTTRFMADKKDRLFLRGHFRVETYYRLLMQDILPGYNKTLYLDSDMIVLDDIAKLYATDINGYLLAAAHDADTAGLYNGFEPQKKDYMDNILKIKDPYGYFQAGTILFNLEEFRKTITVDELFDYASSYEWELLDQDVLNHFGEGRTKFVDMKWNTMMDWNGIRLKEIISLAPLNLYQAYVEAHENPAIVHYAGPDKPWTDPDCDLGEHFWFYSRRTPYYEQALRRFCTETIEQKTLSGRAKEGIWNFGMKLFPYDTKRHEKLALWYHAVRGDK